MPKATWIGPAGLALPDKTPLVPGETVADVPDAVESPYWQPVKPVEPAPPAGGKGK